MGQSRILQAAGPFPILGKQILEGEHPWVLGASSTVGEKALGSSLSLSLSNLQRNPQVVSNSSSFLENTFKVLPDPPKIPKSLAFCFCCSFFSLCLETICTQALRSDVWAMERHAEDRQVVTSHLQSGVLDLPLGSSEPCGWTVGSTFLF